MTVNNNDSVLIVENLKKRFGSTIAVDNLSFELKKGEILGFLGRNGAGKTTTLRCILDLLDIDNSGKISILGKPHKNYTSRQNIGYLPENINLPGSSTARNLLFYYGTLYGISKSTLKNRIPELISMVGLDDVINKKIKTFSKGMKKRLGIASVFLHKPEIYILDEPTTGLDPIIRVDFRNKIKELAKSGNSFLLSSHVLAEIELESDRILIIDEGKKIKEGKTQELLTIPDNIIVQVENKEEALKILSEAGEITAFDEEGNITIKLKKDFTIDDIGTLITENKLGLISIQTQRVHLDDIFYQLTEKDK